MMAEIKRRVRIGSCNKCAELKESWSDTEPRKSIQFKKQLL